MSVSGLTNIVNGTFLTAAEKVSQAPVDEGRAVAKSLSGQSTKETLDTTLRVGARNFSLGLQALNIGISYINVSRDMHEQLEGIGNKLTQMTDRALIGVGPQTARLMVQDFQKYSAQFKDIITNTKIQGNDIFSVDTLKEQMVKAGLDPETTDDLTRSFERMVSLTKTTTDDNGETTTTSTALPLAEFSNAVRVASIDFEDGAGTQNGAEALKKVRQALDEVRSKIQGNLKELNHTFEVVRDNMQLVRAAGLAFLSVSDQIKGTEEADVVAEQVRSEIRRRAPSAALSQADNLQKILTAGVSLAAAAQSKSSS